METYTITQERINECRGREYLLPGVSGPGEYRWNEARNQYEPATPPASESPHDFSHSGLGIGGLATYEEPPVIPTLAQMARVERLEAQAITCRRCRQTDVFDGAMFTTYGGNICDDCGDS